MKIFKIISLCTVLVLSLISCSKTDFLDKKPSTSILVPRTFKDFQSLLDNTTKLNSTGCLAQLGSDDYIIPNYSDYQVISTTERNSYVWNKYLYEETNVLDWNRLYEQVFYYNSILTGLNKLNNSNSTEGQYLKGWALFGRAFAFYDLIRNFCKAYDITTAGTDLGIPIRLSPEIDYINQRATLQQSFNQVLNDLSIAEKLLPVTRPTNNLNRPSKIALYAFFSRVYLDMRNYQQAEANADKCLELYNKLIDYNLVNKNSNTPFSTTNDELIYRSSQIPVYSLLTGNYSNSIAKISPDIINLFDENDLRLPIYFNKLPDGTYTKKKGYNGSGNYPFTGLATDEVYLIKAECLARRNQIELSIGLLNELLIKRWKIGTLLPYQDIENKTPADILKIVLLERRKELIWRGLRWHDLKRLNKEGANIKLTRILNGMTYTLLPNDSKYVFPIPDNEILLSGIQQNLR